MQAKEYLKNLIDKINQQFCYFFDPNMNKSKASGGILY